METKPKYINRELSWLSFNDRVLQEAMDPSVPLIERMHFLGIFSNNLDEFFRVRVATVKRMIGLNDAYISGFEGTPEELLDRIKEVVLNLQTKFEHTYQEILKKLEKEKIHFLTDDRLSKSQKEVVRSYFLTEIRPDIVPIMLDKKRKFPRLRDKGIFLAIKIKQNKTNKIRYALIEIPNTINRFFVLPKNKAHQFFMLIDDVIRYNLQTVFSIFAFEEIEAYTFKFTRDAELDFDDDISTSLLEKMEKSIERRKKGAPVRFVYDEAMPADLLSFLMNGLNLSPGENIIPGGSYHNFKDFINFPKLGNQSLHNEELPAIPHNHLHRKESLVDEILKKDILLYYPYHQFSHLVDLLREAAIDPKVKSIKINLYRVAKQSQVCNALINAVKNGKKVTAVIELLARFDEEHNIYWSNRLKEAGVKIIFGVSGLKVHSKLILIRRKHKKKDQLIAHIGTGNFHEGTAKVYGDFSLLTANQKVAREVDKVFNFLKNNLERGVFRHLVISPFSTRRKFTRLINQEIKNVKDGFPGAITLKLNNLVDDKMIKKLYEASQAGVKIKAIIRGICSLIPGRKGMSENIKVISIVDRYLEHARIIVFENKGDPKYYISSADWMTRNLDKRVEVSTPIYDQDLKNELQKLLEIQFEDNQKARIIEEGQNNKYIEREKGTKKHRSQIETHEYFKKKFESRERK